MKPAPGITPVAYTGHRFRHRPLVAGLLALLAALPILAACQNVMAGGAQRSTEETARLVDRGRYLALIGVCEACHTPPAVPAMPPDPHGTQEIAREQNFRADPNWFQYLDGERQMAGGVPFILRFSADSSGIVHTSNLTPDPETGLGDWTEDEIVEAIRSGKRKDGSALFRFPPHTFYEFLAEEDARALAVYLQSLLAIKHEILPRSLPFPVAPAASVSSRKHAPEGRSQERAAYLMQALVGCRECHSYHVSPTEIVPFAGGDPNDAYNGVFRLGPDLPLRQTDKGWSTFPYPGLAVLYGSNLTKFGLGGPESQVPTADIVRAMRTGIAPHPDADGRPELLSHIMMWQFYRHMTDDDAYSIAEYITSLRYVPHDIGPRLIYFGEDWEAAFKQVFGELPSENDRQIFGR